MTAAIISGPSPWSLVSTSSAHLDHLPHYNGGGTPVGRFYVNQAIDPEYTPPSQPAKILFSIQDQNGNDVYNVFSMVEIYKASTGERLKAFPWTREDIGDFSLYYTFPEIGNYQVVISIANENSNGNYHNGIDPPRTILTDNLNCSCDRGVLNVSVSRSFGNIFSSAVLSGIVGMIAVFGVVAAATYRSRIRGGVHLNAVDKQVLKYSIMLFAIAAGIVHLAVFSEHGSLRLEYSIFLLAAGASQLSYGVMYVLLTLANQPGSRDGPGTAKVYYKKTVILNLFGLIGTSVLLGLYTYSVLLPPPLSPNNRPEDVDFGGILDKSLEVLLVIGIVYLMRWEKKKLSKELVEI
ncbi:MAG TPA: hypothetical protein VFI73_08265 [Candidatus Nitrosopolaris sp.]|nr:hypothetical protein [Candidatus Nitrosopolaris sp.]